MLMRPFAKLHCITIVANQDRRKVWRCISLCDSLFLSTQSIVPLVESLKLLSGPETCIICCYEQRTQGVNPKVERRFFEVRTLCVPFVNTNK